MRARLWTRVLRAVSCLAQLSSWPAVRRALTIAGFLVVGWFLGGALNAYAAEDSGGAPPPAPAVPALVGQVGQVDSAVGHSVATAKSVATDVAKGTASGRDLSRTVREVAHAAQRQPGHEPPADPAQALDEQVARTAEVPEVETSPAPIATQQVIDDIAGELDQFDLSGGLIADLLRTHPAAFDPPASDEVRTAEPSRISSAVPAAKHAAPRHVTPRERRVAGPMSAALSPMGQRHGGVVDSSDVPPLPMPFPVPDAFLAPSGTNGAGQHRTAGNLAVTSGSGLLPAPLSGSAPLFGAVSDGSPLIADDPSFSPE